MTLPRGFRTAVKRGEHPRLPLEETPPPVGQEWVLEKGIGNVPTLTVKVTGHDTANGTVAYLIRDHRPNLLRKAPPSRGANEKPHKGEDRDAGRESAYTSTAKRALAGTYTRKGDQDQYVSEGDAVDEETLQTYSERSREQWDALHAERKMKRQTDGLIKRTKKVIQRADEKQIGFQILRKLQQFVDDLEDEVSAHRK